jgi:hypothetical protein
MSEKGKIMSIILLFAIVILPVCGMLTEPLDSNTLMVVAWIVVPINFGGAIFLAAVLTKHKD